MLDYQYIKDAAQILSNEVSGDRYEDMLIYAAYDIGKQDYMLIAKRMDIRSAWLTDALEAILKLEPHEMDKAKAHAAKALREWNA